MSLSAPERAAARPSDPLLDLSGVAAHLPSDSVLERLGTNPATGLTSEQTSERIAKFGPNELETVRKT